MIGIERQRDKKGRWTGKFYSYYFDMQTNTETILEDNLNFKDACILWSINISRRDTSCEDFLYYTKYRKIRIPAGRM